MNLDPRLSTQQLYEVAQSRPGLWSQILSHPNCEPGLAQWIQQRASSGGYPTQPPTMSAQVETQVYPVPPGQPNPTGMSVQSGVPSPHVPPAMSAQPHSSGSVSTGASTHPGVPGQYIPPGATSQAEASHPTSDYYVSPPPGAGPTGGLNQPPTPKPGGAGKALLIVGLVVLVVLVVLALALGGLVTWWMLRSDPVPPTQDSAGPANYRSGVVKTNVQSLEPGEVPVASLAAVDGKTVYSLAIRYAGYPAGDLFEAVYRKTTPGEAPTQVRAVNLGETSALTAPGMTLCEGLAEVGCSGLDLNVERVFGDYQFAWDEAESAWLMRGIKFRANLLIGVVDSVVFGANVEGGNSIRSDLGSVAVTDLVAFDIETGEKLWTHGLQAPGFVSVLDGELVVIEGFGLPFDLRQYFGAGAYSDKPVDGLFQQLEPSGYKMYRLQPASDVQNADPDPEDRTSAPIIDLQLLGSVSNQTSGIYDFDYLNTPVWASLFSFGECPLGTASAALEEPEPIAPNPIPEDQAGCWLQMNDGFGRYTRGLYGPENKDNISGIQATLTYDRNSAQYVDLNEDGYDDLLVPVAWTAAVEGGQGKYYSVWIYDPDNPAHPLPFQVGGPAPMFSYYVEALPGQIRIYVDSCDSTEPLQVTHFSGAGSAVRRSDEFNNEIMEYCLSGS